MKKIVLLFFLLLGVNAMAQKKIRLHNEGKSFVTTAEKISFDIVESDEVLSITDLQNEIEGLKNDMTLLRKAYKELKEWGEIIDTTVNSPVVEYFRPAENVFYPAEGEVQWSVQGVEYVDISVDGTNVYLGDSIQNAKHFDVLENVGKHYVELFVHNVNGKIYKNFYCTTLNDTVPPAVKTFYLYKDSVSNSQVIRWSVENAKTIDVKIDDEIVYSGSDSVGVFNCDEFFEVGNTYECKIIAHSIVGDVEASRSWSVDPGFPQIGYFYPDYYVGKEGNTPIVQWVVMNATSLEFWIDGSCIFLTQDLTGSFQFPQLNAVGSYVVRMVAHNVIDDAEASFCYRCDPKE